MAEHTLQVTADIGGMQISFARVGNPGYDNHGDAVPVGAVDEINDTLDLWAKAIGRQRAKITLSEKLVDLLASQKAQASLPERENAAMVERTAERLKLIGRFQIEHNASGRRADFKLTPAHHRALAEFDADTEKLRKKFNDERQAHALQQPVLEAQIARLRAVIAGRDPTEALEVEREELAAAD